MLGSDTEWMMVDSEELWLSVEQGTLCSRVWALAEEATDGVGWRDGRGSGSSGESCWHVYRPIERFPESGRGKVPIPLSNVLIWQFDSNIEKHREKLERADRKKENDGCYLDGIWREEGTRGKYSDLVFHTEEETWLLCENQISEGSVQKQRR